MIISRRQLFQAAASTLLIAGGSTLCAPVEVEELQEEHLFDEEAEPNSISISRGLLDAQLNLRGSGKDVGAAKLASRMVEISLALADKKVSRRTESGQRQIERFVHLFDPKFNYHTAFCAAGVSYAACYAYCELDGEPPTSTTAKGLLKEAIPNVTTHYFLPNALVRSISANAKKRGTWVDVGTPGAWAQPQRGWLAVFSFTPRDWPAKKVWPKTHNHIGIALAKSGDVIKTVEYNTGDTNHRDGGHVMRRDRPLVINSRGYCSLMGYIKTY